ncbi:hypothetical protein [Metapseudomonas furukawaii]
MSKRDKNIPNRDATKDAPPNSVKPERAADVKIPTREEARRAPPRDADKPPAKATAKEPPRAAKGDDDLMSQEPRKS